MVAHMNLLKWNVKVKSKWNLMTYKVCYNVIQVETESTPTHVTSAWVLQDYSFSSGNLNYDVFEGISNPIKVIFVIVTQC